MYGEIMYLRKIKKILQMYYKNNYINWNSGLLCAIGGIFGGYIGAIILKKVPDYILKILFTIFILYYAYRMLFVL